MRVPMRDLALLTAADFEEFVGTDFELGGGGSAPERVSIRLTEVMVLPEGPGDREPFSLHFDGPLSPVLAQVIHHVAHAEMGEFELFLGPIAAEANRIVYEAVFA
jgi:hypothetical protein